MVLRIGGVNEGTCTDSAPGAGVGGGAAAIMLGDVFLLSGLNEKEIVPRTLLRCDACASVPVSLGVAAAGKQVIPVFAAFSLSAG